MLDLPRYLMLSTMSNDYEDLKTILRDYAESLKERGMTPTHEETILLLEQLIAEGLAQAYTFAGGSDLAQPAGFSVEKADALWFYVTPKGKQFVVDCDTDESMID